MLTEDSIAQITQNALTVIALAYLVYVIWPRFNLVNIAEINLRLALSWLLLAATLLSSFVLGVQGALSIWYVRTGGANWPAIRYMVMTLTVIVYVVPLPYAIFTYLTAHGSLKRKLRLVPHKDEELCKTVMEYASNIGLKNPTAVFESSNSEEQIFTFGSASRKAFLVLPSSLTQLMREASDASDQDPNALRRFVIYHELSHIKNGDIPLTTWGIVYTKFFLVWFPFSVVLFVLDMLMGRAFQNWLIFVWAGAALSIVSLIFLSRHKELLADARASLHLEKEELQRLSKQPQVRGTTWLDALSFLVSTHSLGTAALTTRTYIPRETTSTFRRIWQKVKSPIFLTHPSAETRILSLERRDYIGARNPLPSGGAYVLAGATAFFLWGSFAQLIWNGSNIASYLHKGVFLEGTASPPLQIAAGVFLFLPCITIGLPFKYLGDIPFTWKAKDVARLFVSRLSFALVALVGGFLLLPVLYPGAQPVKIGWLGTMVLVVGVLAACSMALGVLAAVNPFSRRSGRRREKRP